MRDLPGSLGSDVEEPGREHRSSELPLVWDLRARLGPDDSPEECWLLSLLDHSDWQVRVKLPGQSLSLHSLLRIAGRALPDENLRAGAEDEDVVTLDVVDGGGDLSGPGVHLSPDTLDTEHSAVSLLTSVLGRADVPEAGALPA